MLPIVATGQCGINQLDEIGVVITASSHLDPNDHADVAGAIAATFRTRKSR
jgi:hypothetical protein